MALMTKQFPSAAGVALTYGSVALTDTFHNTGREFLHVKNGSGSSVTVTVTAPNPCQWGITNAVHAYVIVILTLTDEMIGPFPIDRFNNASSIVTVTYSAITTVTSALISSN